MTDFGSPLISAGRAFAVAVPLAGGLDIAGAMAISAFAGRGPVTVLQSIAGALLGRAAYAGGLVTAALGLAIHLTIMSAMVGTFVAVAARAPFVLRARAMSGVVYGLILYVVMYLIVLPLRWPTIFPTADPVDIAGQLICHVALVGLPIALVTAHCTSWSIRATA